MEMLVGQQVQLTVTATAGENAAVEFPQEATFPQGVEFLGAIDMPDVPADEGQVTRQRGYVLTSFEDTLYYLPPMEVRVDGKVYQTKKLALKVLTVDVDTTNILSQLAVGIDDSRPAGHHTGLRLRARP